MIMMDESRLHVIFHLLLNNLLIHVESTLEKEEDDVYNECVLFRVWKSE